MKKLLAMILLLGCSTAFSGEMKPLSEFIRQNPKFKSDPVAAIFITSRCSALFSKVTTKLLSDSREEKQQQGKDFEDYGTIYDGASMHLSKTIGMTQKIFLSRYKTHLDSYEKEVMKNFNLKGDMFEGWIGKDLEICTDNFNYFFEYVHKKSSKEINI
jgi:hypothetical protein